MLVPQQQHLATDVQAADYVPIRMLEIEIGQALPTIYAFDKERERAYQRIRCLVRLHTQPLGIVELQHTEDELAPHAYAPHIWQTLHRQINEHLVADCLPEVTELSVAGLPASTTPLCIDMREQFLARAPFVSVIVPTHERPEMLSACLDTLLAQDYQHYEVIVVDNAPATDVTETLVTKLKRNHSHIRYVREDRQGPSWARNCGIQASRAEILAFTDDDVVVDKHWLTSLIAGFEEDGAVACVTGLVLPRELETMAQFLFEEVGGYGKGYHRHAFAFQADQAQLPLHPYMAERFGTGASMALTANFLHSIGGFDPALGRVGPVRCSQDIAVFFQVIVRGYKLVYEPASLAYHSHRREYADLCRQTYNHSVGYTAYLTRSLLEKPRLLFDFIAKVPFALFIALKTRNTQVSSALAQYAKQRQELLMLRRKGLLYGPIAFVRSRWEINRLGSKERNLA